MYLKALGKNGGKCQEREGGMMGSKAKPLVSTLGRFSLSAELTRVAAFVRVQDGHSDLGSFLPPPPP